MKKNLIRGALLVTSGAAKLSSIPFLWHPQKNKRQDNLALKTETGYIILNKFNYSTMALIVKL